MADRTSLLDYCLTDVALHNISNSFNIRLSESTLYNGHGHNKNNKMCGIMFVEHLQDILAGSDRF